MASRETCLDRLVRIHGGMQSEAARKLDVTRQMVAEWKRKGYIPAIYALEVEEASDGAILARQVIQEARDILKPKKTKGGKRKSI